MAEPIEPTRETMYLPPAAPHHNHGHTTAAWTTTIVVLLGVLVAAGAVVASLPWLFWVGIGFTALGVVSGKVLAVLGYGQPDLAGR